MFSLGMTAHRMSGVDVTFERVDCIYSGKQHGWVADCAGCHSGRNNAVERVPVLIAKDGPSQRGRSQHKFPGGKDPIQDNSAANRPRLMRDFMV
jgi:hypothetical protein